MPVLKGKFETKMPPLGYERRSGGAGGGRVVQPRQVMIYPCRAEGLGRPVRASISDLSNTGLGLVCLGRLEVGSKFVMKMMQANTGAGGAGGTPLLQVYRVTRCREAGGAASMIGALYDGPFTAACRAQPTPGRR
jgi:hypothetical protein